MTASALLLLTGIRDDASSGALARQPLARNFRLIAPPVDGAGPSEGPFDLGHSAAGVASALDAEGVSSTAVCGVGLGAMIALRLAAEQPDRVSRLALLTRQVGVSPLLMSLPAAVLALVPAAAVARLGAGRAQVLALLDQARPVDAVPLAAGVSVPSVVLCGARDRLNRRASARLAEALPHGRLELIPRAGPGWLAESPHLLVEALTAEFRG